MKRNPIRLSLILAAFLTFLVVNIKLTAQQINSGDSTVSLDKQFAALKFRNIGPFRGGRSVAVCGVVGDPMTYYFGSTGGGVWKTDDAGITWRNISDGFFNNGSVGAIAVSASDPNVIYVGMGEHPVRGVMTSHGDGVYKSTDAGKTWTHIGLNQSRHIAAIRIHPSDPDTVYVAVQGAVFAGSTDRGVYRSSDGGKHWENVLFVNETTGAADLSMDPGNPRILYAGMWDHQRTPWQVRSGGPGSGIHKSTDGGTTWNKLGGGLPEKMGKVAIDVSPANSEVVYANVEAKKGGVFRSSNGGQTWTQVNSDRVTVARAWYYIEIFADPQNQHQVYVLNAPMLKSIDGGKTFASVPNPHTDQHDLWINPANPNNMILANDGGACVTFNGGKSWSTENNQPTAQFYRVITDNQFPYRIYAGQQDNSTVSIASRSRDSGIGQRDWFPTAGGESAFLAFDPDNPDFVYGTSIQGILDRHDLETDERKSVVVYPQLNLGTLPKDQKYRFNWNAPIVAQHQDPQVLYYGGNVVFRSDDKGHSWTTISDDLTRNQMEKHGDGGIPFTNEAAGGEVYNTISYLAASPHQAGVVWVGTDDGLIHRTDDEGQTWQNVTPHGLEESLINAVDLSPHDSMTAFVAVTRYKFNDLRPLAYKTIDNGKSWGLIVNGIADDHFIRVVRQDPVNSEILYAGTEGGLYISFNQGARWQRFQLNLPVCPITDLTFQDNDLIVATSGRAFWILDDMAAIQQSGGDLDFNGLKLFQPKPAFKFSSAGAGSASAFQGQNPDSGVVFDYVLPKSWSDDMTLKLTVSDQNGNVVRRITSAESKQERWEGGPSPAPRLPAKCGLNRFHWDLRGEPVPAVRKVFMFGGYNAARVVPGQYTLQLSCDNDLFEPAQITATVNPDPRVQASEEDYRQQQMALDRINKLTRKVNQSVIHFRQVKSQLAGRIRLLKTMPEQSELLKTARQAMKQIDAWERRLIQPKQKTFQDVINFPNRLSAEFAYLNGQLDTNEPRPTAAALARLDELDRSWQQAAAEMQSIVDGSVRKFNETWKSNDLPVLIVPDGVSQPTKSSPIR